MSATRHSHVSHHPSLPHLTERLRRKSRKVTGPRQALLELLPPQAHPMTSKEIFDALPKDLCDLATVYRSLRLLEQMGMVKRFDFGDGTARFRSEEHTSELQ